MYKFNVFTGTLLLIIAGLTGFAQPGPAQRKSIDKVAAVVGAAVILQSDIEQQYVKYLTEGGKEDDNIRCYILQQLLTQKLLSQQAIIDSITVTDDEVDDQIDRRMRYAINRMGGPDKLEQMLNRSILQYKDEIRPEVREQLVADKMQRKITEKVTITPLEVRRFFDAIPKDSLPTYNAEVEVGQIVTYPKPTRAEKEIYRDKAEALRLRIKAGEDFGTLASLYSQDPGSAANGGDLGFIDRGSLDKNFAAQAFTLKEGEMSQTFETDFGFHFLQVLERRGDQVHARHVLIKIESTPGSLARTKGHIDSIYTNVTTKRLPFSTAASLYSDDQETKYNGGVMLNPENAQARTTYIPTDKLDVSVFSAIDTMKVGSYSHPEIFTSADGKQGYRFFYLKSKTNPHKASLEQDFPKIKDVAMEDKTNRTVSQWFEKRRKTTYTKIDPEFQACESLKIWVKEQP
ncbi:peptidylprolyl isomerase [Hufsiella ginkgonis]|uniref:Peptidylprolyl isomerase n=1 Tax=Hufsiella ginkgonis TaxID=2695274 RepID=A0A7K1Y1E3_9SPHI|nr:peptidylprolyl isomerase [Hufsiella ginkgonis]MXV16937.1 peptidylprolyl isomerase [Hufsiella ginkgonis]